MMEAYVSGQVARAAFVQGNEVFFIDGHNPDVEVEASLADLPLLFLGADDVEKLNVKDKRNAFPLLIKGYYFDRGLQLLDAALNEEDEIAFEAALLFEGVMEYTDSIEAIRNYVLAAENLALPDEVRCREFRRQAPRFAQFVDELKNSQVHIARFNSALKRAFESEVIESDARAEFVELAISTGSFRSLVEAGSDTDRINQAVLRCFANLSRLPRSRATVQAWTKDFIHKRTKREMLRQEQEMEHYEEEGYIPKSSAERSSYEDYQAVLRQKASIIEKLKGGDVRQARRFAGQLVEMQLQHGGPVFAAKSLSSLAVEARKLGQHSIELEWARASTELRPDDGRAVGILADTYLALYRIPEAEVEFQRALELGEDEFGMVGIGRVKKASGRYNEALAIFDKAIERFGYDNVASETMAVRAETLRNLWKYDEALLAYDAAISLLPGEVGLICGKAAVLTDIGSLDEAADVYKSVIAQTEDEPAAWCGLANVNKLRGEWDDALTIYDKAIALFPENEISYCGKADVLRSRGSFSDALAAYRSAAERFPFSPTPVSGEADTLKDMREYGAALDVFRGALDKFHLDSRLRNGYANALKLVGKFKDALQQFDSNVHDFPYDLYALGGRANLLRLLGNYEAALTAYDQIMERRPDNRFASNAKAAILIAQGEYASAITLLDNIEPKTEDEWTTLHLRGMLYLKQGDFGRAKELFSSGFECSFYRKRIVFETAYALAELRSGEPVTTFQRLRTHNDNISNILSTHILMKGGDFASAAKQFSAVNDNLPTPLLELAKTIRKSIETRNLGTADQERNVFDREIEVILQAA